MAPTRAVPIVLAYHSRALRSPRWRYAAGLAARGRGSVTELAMTNPTFTVFAALFLGLAALFVARPYIDYQFYAQTTPRPIEPRGDLAEFERSTIALFERVSPSVVQ